ncbi:manganese-dependent inorganic pyrophosphatase [Carnobacterium divergens]|uniref:Probable manganese-dependent inorganic pyrophosphatase n=1 Tax=Carnobacterium divergens TaxID=2748 RepID=A0A7Z8CX59_CARDV|nr:manganese-dependent inorganic pyrophosphatase [Carnobacterium divergens]MPQ21351.1 manganese-dependent inorganic pyrophosphatase [Carnobacterium divergens]TFI71392.1 manganese-dependent inorganic pyrophosphatase [Carnobacterium divergens]TFI76034.1 manganese-dependent inorganic pyrophosphatase [Carnobacterium divergens]TFI81906.1 manganese-dependent inorganic pyrophosphatase [Carnobacterium divergens]TFI94215.1 manganese-dependent inorganic pyrophosphatase [Carnobacterium divergens]
MSNVLIFGHLNPDTDAITSAISFAYLQKQLGVEAEAVALGNVSEETAFALNYFNVAAPRVVETVANETNQVMLVDHNEFQQSVSDIREVEVLAVVDHHRIANFETANPLYYRAEPVGCTNTIILKMYKEHQITIPKEIAGLMASAIISDSLLFKSPTCTQEDIAAAKELATIAEIDLETYGLDLLKAGTNLADKSAADLLNMDAKSFPMGDKNVRIAQVNTVDINDVFIKQPDLEAAMKKEDFDLFILVVTNILDSDSVILAVGEPISAVEKAFNVTLENNKALLKGVVSRKKQVVPQLTEALS